MRISSLRRQVLLAVVVVAVSIGSSPAQTQQESDSGPVSGPVPNTRQSTSVAPTRLEKPGYVSPSELSRSGFSGHIVDFVEDQTRVWTSPARIRLSDATWLVPLAGITAGLFATDRNYSASINQNPSTLKHYKTVSNAGIAGLIGAGAGLYFLSFPTHNERWRETGFLAGEAALNSLLTMEVLKYSLGRQRPYQGNGSGSFFHAGTSFPSEHAAAAWSIAGVLAHEYPGKIPSLLAYGVASAVSLSRIQGRQHFPADVLVGSALGYLISQDIFRRRHNPELGGSAWQSPREFVNDPAAHKPSFMGSPYVPLDSWIYPAMERLAAMGYIRSSILGLRPWTRLECARLLGEAAEREPDADAPVEVQDLYDSLSEEFQSEMDASADESTVHSQIESIYARGTAISDRPLTDNEHFGQTVLNDYGRPFQQGFNSIVGTSGWATAGPFVIYARGEHQSAPSAPSLSPAALNFISTADALPPNPPAMPFAAVSRFRLLDAYVGMNFANWQISFGKQSLWWGPGDEGAMLFTNNAEPLNKMFRVNRVTPIHLPGVFGYLGDIRMEFFIGQDAGQQFINNAVQKVLTGPAFAGQYGEALPKQPFVSGGKISFKFNPNFEISMSKTTLYGGLGNPLTAKTFLKSTFSVQVNGFGLGDGRAALDFAYRIPKMRDWLSLYVDSFQEDEMSPLNRPYKAVFQSGLYLTKFPRIPKLDLRMEGGTTSPINFPSCNGCFYMNGQYLGGYTNNGVLMGTWLGRAAQGETIKSTYWLSGTKRIGIEMRHRKVDRQFLPGGGTQNDVAVNTDLLLKSRVELSGKVQYESWQIPLLTTGQQSNVAASLQISYWPKKWAKRTPY